MFSVSSVVKKFYGGFCRVMCPTMAVYDRCFPLCLCVLCGKKIMADFVAVKVMDTPQRLGMVKRMIMEFSQSVTAKRRGAFPDRFSLCSLCPLW